MGPDCVQVFRDMGPQYPSRNLRRYGQLAQSVFIKGRSMDTSVISLLNVLEEDEVGGVLIIGGHYQGVPQGPDTSQGMNLRQSGGPCRDCGKYDGL